MLRTNGGIAARDRYSDECGGLCIIPGRLATDRIIFGYAMFKIHYRFAGVIVPGLNVVPPLQPQAEELTVLELK